MTAGNRSKANGWCAVKYRGIYRITNRVTGETYVGKAASILDRIRYHFQRLADGKHFNPLMQRSYDLHGRDAFVWDVVELYDGLDLAGKEWQLIGELRPTFNLAGPHLGRQPQRKTRRHKAPAAPVATGRRIIRDAVKAAMLQARWSMRQLSVATGISYSRIHDWLTGDAPLGPREAHIDRILKALGLVVR